jgi:hypothetical protein
MTDRAPVTVGEARAADLAQIAELRHSVYASELGQYPSSPDGRLADSHPFSTVLCARRGARVVGFVAITPPAESARFVVRSRWSGASAVGA